jgi:multiple sugar transport system ATP-binding protein
MDEPLSNLDARLRLSMRGEIKRLCHRLGATTIYVTHDQAEALTMADLVAVMRQGELQQLAPPADVYERPANRFVALFVGNPPMNLLQCAVDARGIHVAGAIVPIDQLRHQDCLAAGVMEIGIRPEDIRVAESGRPGVLSGEVYVVEPMGNETLVDVRFGEQRLTFRAPKGFTAAIGSPLGVAFDAADACFFDQTGSTKVHRVRNKGGPQ